MNGLTQFLVFIPGVRQPHESMACTGKDAIADAIYTLGLSFEPPGIYVLRAGLIENLKEPECSSAT